jgi:cell wall-associated NlpC family hydrolase
MTRSGFDCSVLVCLVFKEISTVDLPHTTSKMKHLGYVIPLRKAASGDLLFFRSGRLRRIDHVGIFLGGDNGMFAHASSSKGVIYSYLSDDYHERHLVEVRRITK